MKQEEQTRQGLSESVLDYSGLSDEATQQAQEKVEPDATAVSNKLAEIVITGYRIGRLRGSVVAMMNIIDLLESARALSEEQEEPMEEGSKTPEIDEHRIVRLIIDGLELSSEDLELKRDHDVDFLEMLPKLREKAAFTRKDVLALGFYNGASEASRAQALQHTRRRVFGAIESFTGKPVVKRVGSKGSTKYKFRANIERHPEDQIPEYPLRDRVASNPISGRIQSPTKETIDGPEGPPLNIEGSSPEELREMLRPAIEWLIKERRKPQRPGPRTENSNDNYGRNKAVDVSKQHWGIGPEGQIIEPMSLDEISMATTAEKKGILTTFSVKALIKDALKEIGYRLDEYAELAKAYMDWLDEQ